MANRHERPPESPRRSAGLPPLSDNLRGALVLTLAMAAGALSDTLVKSVAEHMPIGQVIVLRGIAASILVYFLARRQGALRSFRDALHPMVLVRSFGEIGAAVTYLLALAHLPIANASALLQALPLAVTAGAAVFLGEAVGWRRWSATLAGFAGVLIVVRPGLGGFNPWSLLVLLTVAFAALRDIATRRVPAEIPSLFISMLNAPAVALTGAAMMLLAGDAWQPVSPIDAGLLLVTAVLVIVTYQFITLSMRVGDVSFVAPFRYTNLMWAILLGIAVFGDRPDAPMLLGSLLIVASGLYTLHRERRTAAKR